MRDHGNVNQASSKGDRANRSLRDGRVRVFSLGTVFRARLHEGAQPQRTNVEATTSCGDRPRTPRTGLPQLPSVCKQVCDSQMKQEGPPWHSDWFSLLSCPDHVNTSALIG